MPLNSKVKLGDNTSLPFKVNFKLWLWTNISCKTTIFEALPTKYTEKIDYFPEIKCPGEQLLRRLSLIKLKVFIFFFLWIFLYIDFLLDFLEECVQDRSVMISILGNTFWYYSEMFLWWWSPFFWLWNLRIYLAELLRNRCKISLAIWSEF